MYNFTTKVDKKILKYATSVVYNYTKGLRNKLISLICTLVPIYLLLNLRLNMNEGLHLKMTSFIKLIILMPMTTATRISALSVISIVYILLFLLFRYLSIKIVVKCLVPIVTLVELRNIKNQSTIIYKLKNLNKKDYSILISRYIDNNKLEKELLFEKLSLKEPFSVFETKDYLILQFIWHVKKGESGMYWMYDRNKKEPIFQRKLYIIDKVQNDIVEVEAFARFLKSVSNKNNFSKYCVIPEKETLRHKVKF